MTIKEFKEFIKDYPEDNFIHIRIWFDKMDFKKDIVVDKLQFGVDGSVLVTGHIDNV